MEDKAILNIVFYEPQKPILVPIKKIVSFVENKKESYIFKADLDGEWRESWLKMKMDFGYLGFVYLNNIDEVTNPKKNSMNLPLAKFVDYEPPLKLLDIKIFHNFYSKVDAKELTTFIFNI